MPPRTRKTAQSRPEADETVVDPAAEGGDEGAPEAQAEPNDSDDSDDSDGSGEFADNAPALDGDEAPESERSDLQAVDEPCAECFPNGWPAPAYSVGCAHGTWVRDTTD